MEFGNLVTIKEKGCQIKKGMKKRWEHMKIRLVYCLLCVLQQLSSYNNYRHVTITIL
jgi:hypothetical protein